MAALTSGFAGVGTTLGYRTTLTGTGAYTLLNLVKDDMDYSGMSTTVIELPILAAVVKSKTGGHIDAGDLTFTVYFVPGEAGTPYLYTTLFANRTVVAWQMQTPDGSSSTTGSTLTFSGLVSMVKPSGFGDTDATMDVTVTLTNLPVLTPGS